MVLQVHQLSLLLTFAAAATASSACPQILSDTCYRVHKDSYNSAPAELEECCKQCEADGELCQGFTVNAAGNCNLLDQWNETNIYHGAGCSSGRVHHSGKLPLPPTIKPAPRGAKNVLFLVADDMRPSIGPYASPAQRQAGAFSTPHLDQLAATGLTFGRAYVQFSYCAPSRNSFMSGRRPDATKAYSFIGTFREPGVGANWSSLPQHFVENGYTVAGSGKLFHPGVPANDDTPLSWSADYPYYQVGDNVTNMCNETCCGIGDGLHYCAYEPAPGTFLSDQRNTQQGIDNLRHAGALYKRAGKPFFVGVGFHKPHLNWQFPREYWDRIPSDTPAAKHLAFPADVPAIAWHECAECSSVGPPAANGSNSIAYFDTAGNGRLPPPAAWQADMRRAYYATIAYVDGLIGQLLGTLDELGLTNDTIVAFTGDHGWSLGEHDVWCKMQNSELGTRVPLLIRAPHKAATSAGHVTPALAELVDLFPTLSDLAGLALPSAGTAAGAHLGGSSQAPLFDAPAGTPVKQVALSQFPRCWQNNTGHDPTGAEYGPGDERNHTVSFYSMSDCHWVRRSAIDFMGYSMRTERYRYIQWMRWDGDALRPLWDEVVGRELYDHGQLSSQLDTTYMDDAENENMAPLPENRVLVAQLSARLKSEVTKWFTPNP